MHNLIVGKKGVMSIFSRVLKKGAPTMFKLYKNKSPTIVPDDLVEQSYLAKSYLDLWSQFTTYQH